MGRSLSTDFSKLQLAAYAGVIAGFQEAGAQMTMDLDCGEESSSFPPRIPCLRGELIHRNPAAKWLKASID
jgi:uncharacterized membrane protein YagU involved in acid resistance